MHLGEVEIQAVSDGMYWEDGGGLFGLVPRALWERVWAPDERNRLPFEQWSLLIVDGTQRILVDTGYGDKLTEKERSFISLTGERRLVGNLESMGIQAGDIDVVINTHLHGDHCGGNTYLDRAGKPYPTFPNAAFFVQRLELADAMYPNERTRATYRRENFLPLEEAGQLRVLSGDARLTDHVRVEVTPGHTRGHQAVIVESQRQCAAFLGDVASWPIHMERLSWVPAFDVEPLVSIETKRRLAHWAIEAHALLIFEHHPKIIAGYLEATDRPDRFQLEPIAI
jgi:glyoxylase-like metal-dependent hydrolase (beta-lactamase superfamily II)